MKRFIKTEFAGSSVIPQPAPIFFSEKTGESKKSTPTTEKPPAQKVVGKQRAKRSVIERRAAIKMRRALERAFRLIT